MLDTPLLSLIVATALGFLAGLGVGGGSLLVLWLTLVLDYSHPQARIINLLFFIPSAFIACIFRWRQGSLDFKKVFPAILAGCISAAISSQLATVWDLAILKKMFGVLLLAAGIRELTYKE